MASFREIGNQLFLNFKGSTTGQKIAAVIILAIVLGGLLYLTSLGTKLQYGVLYSGLTEEDAADVVTRLKEERIPYQLSANGSTIMVPASQVHEIRLSLAGEGLPRGGGVGLEIFDKTTLAMTDFVQRLNFQRATQGELARTIRQFQQVEQARVHIATPKESVFIEDAKPPTASVSVKLRGNEQLSKSQVQAIVHLVASAIPGLTPENIAVVDTTGRLLYRGHDGQDSFLSGSQLEYQFTVEETLRKKIETMLEEVVGIGHVRARVTAGIDFNRVDYTEENFDPESQVVRSEQMQNEGNPGGESIVQGIPGVKGELAGSDVVAGSAALASGAYQRSNITRNYEINKQTKHVQEASGSISRLSVAVMVDGTYVEIVDKEGKSSIQYKPRSSEEMQNFEKLVKNAIGYSEDREDKVEVIPMSFAMSTMPESEPEAVNRWLELVERYAIPFLLPALGMIFLFFFGRAFLKMMASRPMEFHRPATAGGVSPGVEFGEGVEEDLHLQPRPLTDREKIYRLAQSDPDRAADLVRRWLREEV